MQKDNRQTLEKQKIHINTPPEKRRNRNRDEMSPGREEGKKKQPYPQKHRKRDTKLAHIFAKLQTTLFKSQALSPTCFSKYDIVSRILLPHTHEILYGQIAREQNDRVSQVSAQVFRPWAAISAEAIFWGCFWFSSPAIQTYNEFGGAILFFDVHISACRLAFKCAISCPISLWGLKPACLGISRGAAAMLQEFLRRQKMGRQTWFQFQGGFRCWTWNLLTASQSFKGFLRWIFWSQNTKEKSAEKNRRKIRQPKTKNPPAHDPPEKSPFQAQKSAAKPTNKSACQSSKYTPDFFRLRRLALGGFFRAWILGHSGCLLRMVEAPILKCTCNPSSAAGGRDKVCCAPFQTTLLVKSVRFEKWPKNNEKIRYTTLPTLAAQLFGPKSEGTSKRILGPTTQTPGTSQKWVFFSRVIVRWIVSQVLLSRGRHSVGVWICGVWNGHFQSPINILQRPNFAGKSLEFRRKATFAKCQALRFEISETEKLQLHTPSHSIPPPDSLLFSCFWLRVFRLFFWLPISGPWAQESLSRLLANFGQKGSNDPCKCLITSRDQSKCIIPNS